MLQHLAALDQFSNGRRGEQAELILLYLYEAGSREGVEIGRIMEAFGELHLSKGNASRIREHFRKSRNVRKVGGDKFAPTLAFLQEMEGKIQIDAELDESAMDITSIALPPFVSEERQEHLTKMVRVYAHLFLLENSMRGLIEKVLSDHLGDAWWEEAASRPMKKKHEDRVKNENSKKWAPTRSDFGPLYALDWPDLITLMRKYPDHFKPYLGDINFLHRFEDAGAFRNVVAHNGVLSEQDDFELIRIYYQNWVAQLS